MDWTSIINTLIISIFGGGGLFVGIKQISKIGAERREAEAKNLALYIDNNAKLIDQWQEIAESRKNRCDELKEDLDKRESEKDQLYKTISILRNDLDHERTGHAIAELLKCDKIDCMMRNPPYGAGVTMSRNFKKQETK